MIPFSVLDLSPIVEGASAADALRNSADLARHAEALGYRRYWLAEHHNMPGIASAATAVVIGHVAAGTRTIRVGSGGIMLPNHAPLVIAEQFGTLESLFPGRIDLGLGRAPGTDMTTARALRRDLATDPDRFPQDVVELRAYLSPAVPGQRIRAVPGEGLKVPIWLLGSSLFSAQLAAMLGMPFAFASHFAPADMMAALEIYRSRFEPSAELDRPYAMLGVNVIAADTDAEAERLFTSLQQSFVNLRRGQPGRLPPPIEDFGGFASPAEQAQLRQALACSFVGGPDRVRAGLAAFIERTGADELILGAHIFDHAARLRSFAIAAEVRDTLAAGARQGER
ncbi:MAG TPA: LLM class flavin-dependent oxidoreductase [Dongiaceae bacterium]|jgi:luciferase family oxidoreductase group 1|nr:LLM class flavin-dependent oxidoreductase [Dongiaceae bacterium]